VIAAIGVLLRQFLRQFPGFGRAHVKRSSGPLRLVSRWRPCTPQTRHVTGMTPAHHIVVPFPKASSELLRAGRSCANLSPSRLDCRAVRKRRMSRSRQLRARRRTNGQTVRAFEIICEEAARPSIPVPGRFAISRLTNRQTESEHDYQNRIGACFGDDRIGQRSCFCQSAS